MVPKRQLKEGVRADSEPNKRRQYPSTMLNGASNSRNLQECMPGLEPLIRKWVQEEVIHGIERFMRPSSVQIDCLGSRRLQLQFCSNLPRTLFTGSRVMSEDGSPIKIALYNSTSEERVTRGPLSSTKVNIVVLDGDFGADDQEDWSKEHFDSKVVQNRIGKRPLVAGELSISLQDGVGNIGEVIFTDNSSWIRSGKFRLGAVVQSCPAKVSIREAMSSPFRVKDHRGESYQKHYPPSLEDEVWRLEKIAKDGPSHRKLTQFGISCVGDLLRFYETSKPLLLSLLPTLSNRTWEIIIRHATSCTLDDKKYVYKTAQGTGLLFNSIYKVVGVTFDGQNYLSSDNLDKYQMKMVQDLKQNAYKNMKDWVSVCDQSFFGNPTLFANPTDNFIHPNLGLQDANFQVEQDQLEMLKNNHPPTISPPHDCEGEQENSSFELGESSHMQGFNLPFRNSFEMSDSPDGFYGQTWAPGSSHVESQLSTEDLPGNENYQVESAWQGNGLFLGSNSHETCVISSNSGTLIPRSARPRASWCKILSVIKWQILVKRIVAARKWKQFYNYIQM